MSTKTILWIVVAVVVVGGGIWWWLAMSQGAMPAATAPASNPPAQAPAMQGQMASSTPSSTSMGNPGNVSANDNSNAGLDASLSNVDTQMNGFSSDNASVTQGMNDQPVSQN